MTSSKLSFAEKAGYSMGDAAANFVFMTMILFQTNFYTDTFGLSASAAAAILLWPKLWDAFFDPVMGVLADRTNTRWGKFRPWILWTAVPWAVVMVLAYTTPKGWSMGALIAYVQSLPPVPAQAAVIRLPLPARVLYGFGQMPDAADKIDHTLPPQQAVPEGVTLEHGKYVANMCLGCHGMTLAGGRIPGAPPDWPPAAQLAGEGNVMKAHYADAQTFVDMLKSGKRSDGHAIAVMPFEALSKLSDTDARALHLYLTSLRP